MTSQNVTDRMIARIDAVLDSNARLDRYNVDDENVLTYIRSKLRSDELEKRAEDPFDTGSVSHLLEVAKMRLSPYEEAVNNDD